MSSRRSKGLNRNIRVVINDASCLIDLRKVAMVEAILGLPYRFVVTLPTKENELFDFSADDWVRLERLGFEIVDLTGDQVSRALELRTQCPGLSPEDCFALALAAEIEASILLTGDAQLRKVAEASGLEVHGALWIVEQLHQCGLVATKVLVKSLEIWRDDPLVRIPDALIAARLKSLK